MSKDAGQIQPRRTLDKILLVGRIYSGKRTLLYRYAHGKMPEINPYCIQGFPDNGSVHVDGTEVVVDLLPLREPGCSGLGDATSERNQWLFYPKTSAFIICFSIADRDTFEEVKERWGPELKYYLGRRKVFKESGILNRIRRMFLGMEKIPILLVGCQKDLRKENNGAGDGMISSSEGETLASEIGAAAYFECSSITGEGVDEVFKEAVRLAIEAEDGKDESPKSKW